VTGERLDHHPSEAKIMVKIKKKVYESGGSLVLGIPKDVAEALGLHNESEIYIDVDEGKKGKHGVFWPIEDDQEEKSKRR
jgi:hypothetical protein